MESWSRGRATNAETGGAGSTAERGSEFRTLERACSIGQGLAQGIRSEPKSLGDGGFCQGVEPALIVNTSMAKSDILGSWRRISPLIADGALGVRTISSG